MQATARRVLTFWRIVAEAQYGLTVWLQHLQRFWQNGLQRFEQISGYRNGLDMKCRVAAGRRFGTVCAILVFLKIIDFASIYGLYCGL